ncbi:SHOCT domain-containing protein [Deinococcus hopiensis]|uniref:Short C-terminal domain-containing protein n=1 Tax=Deinococcus hopiensis KR-140 TaxID=695939 RepID=A0A1W1UTC8_9DEIO|nr:SHOCT domain-containing protein [Deinococcus hopiensis]SMB84357.1 Short C-terminal domain-containing protein [Deinococcus hopiensis KR-140]
MNHEKAFAEFDRNRGNFAATWNWGSFALGPIWYLSNGMPAKAGIYTAAALTLIALSGGALALPVWIAFGLLGYYDLYLLQHRNTPLWGRLPSALAHPFSGAQPAANFEMRFRVLKESHDKGLLDGVEFEEKRGQLLKRLEHEEKLQQLEKALQAGVFTQEEYDVKVQQYLGS